MPQSGGPTYTKTVGFGVSGDLTALTNVAQTANTLPGEIHSWSFNNTGSQAWLRIYNAASGDVTMATTVPIQQFKLLANQISTPPQGFIPQNCTNLSGWSMAVTGEGFDAVNATVPAATITGTFQYKQFQRQGISAQI